LRVVRLNEQRATVERKEPAFWNVESRDVPLLKRAAREDEGLARFRIHRDDVRNAKRCVIGAPPQRRLGQVFRLQNLDDDKGYVDQGATVPPKRPQHHANVGYPISRFANAQPTRRIHRQAEPLFVLPEVNAQQPEQSAVRHAPEISLHGDAVEELPIAIG